MSDQNEKKYEEIWVYENLNSSNNPLGIMQLEKQYKENLDKLIGMLKDGEELPRIEVAYGGIKEKDEYSISKFAFRVVPPKKKTPSIICISGSSRFIGYVFIKKWELEKQGHVVLTMTLLPSWYPNVHPDHQAEHEGVSKVLDEVHLRKIDLADELLVMNINGYIGESTKKEIEYAKMKGKTITYLEPITTQKS